MRNIERYADRAPALTEQGFDVWMVDYPGYGKSTGKRTEQTMYQDAILLYDLASKEASADQLIIYGRSIGTGVASYLASQKPCQQLILETPYYNIETLARHYAPMFPVKTLMRYRFPVNEYLQKVQAPITILHGTHDEIIPYRHAKRLGALKGVQLISISKGTHNNLAASPQFQQAIAGLLSR
jgi:pimeloyl-ACP methyl ester carboxylesterase